MRRHLLAIFNGGCPFFREYHLAKREQIPKIFYWAFDQFCLFSWHVGEPPEETDAQVV